MKRTDDPEKWKVFQDKRARTNKELMSIPIPKKLPGGALHPHFWYIIYEGNLIKPTLLNKAFKNKAFAIEYRDSNLSEHRVNILSGKKLIDYGFEKAWRSLKNLTGSSDSDTTGNYYAFLKELPAQRRKTLRTMYRRNLRRILSKLIRNGRRKAIFFNR